VLGRHLFDVVPRADHQDQLEAALRTLEEKGRWFGEGDQIARDGSRVKVSACMTVLCDDRGEPLVFVSVNRQAHAPALSGDTPPADTVDEDDIRRGLLAGEFVVHYQPVVALDDRRVLTVEALVRWQHPERGLLTPKSFIDTAERSGLILDLGREVFDQASRQTAEWRRAGYDLNVSINLSTKQFADPALFDDIIRMLAASGLDPTALWLEVTETALVEDLDEATDLLERLAELGIGITIDDFGTGWASLTYLKEFPVHALKIDQSFVAGVDHNAHDAAIARSIISLAKELDMIVVAEGVETIEQHAALRKLGCSIGQGFLYGKPGPASTVPVEQAHRL
jgi:EAL domain-containing protein (putative c-di-GMP-specific phosphodiesterase class I)